ncbi:MAG: putative secreted protein [Bryobacterales bacterium]|jgi:hypothetical protein|nr:putative secreted protein [Bryobacterales bacterium]
MTTSDIVSAAKLSEEGKTLAASEPGPTRFVQLLESRGLFKDAIQFLTHGLPIEVSIRWGCTVMRELLGEEELRASTEALEAAERWLETPGDEARWRAKSAAEKSGMSLPPDLIAMAAFFSGASVTPVDTPPTAPPIYVANRMAANAIQLAVLSRHPEKAPERYRRALQIGRQVVKPNPK